MRQPKNLKALDHFRDMLLSVKKIKKILSSLILNITVAEHKSGSEEGLCYIYLTL